jgi:hypothetical protein
MKKAGRQDDITSNTPRRRVMLNMTQRSKHLQFWGEFKTVIQILCCGEYNFVNFVKY